MNDRRCSFDDCTKPHLARGWCSTHYQRWCKYGDPAGGRPTFDGDPLRFLRAACTTVAAHDPGWPFACDSKGYGSVMLDGRRASAHRAAWEHVHGSIPDGRHVLHRCDTPRCFFVEHLFLGTQSENVADMDRKGRRWRPIGEANPRAKLSAADVLAIRALPTHNYAALGRQYGVADVNIRAVVLRHTWKHLP